MWLGWGLHIFDCVDSAMPNTNDRLEGRHGEITGRCHHDTSQFLHSKLGQGSTPHRIGYGWRRVIARDKPSEHIPPSLKHLFLFCEFSMQDSVEASLFQPFRRSRFGQAKTVKPHRQSLRRRSPFWTDPQGGADHFGRTNLERPLKLPTSAQLTL